MIQFTAYPADTLYILTENQSTLVSKLINSGKSWKADSVEVIDSNSEEYGYFTQFKLRESLAEKEKTKWQSYGLSHKVANQNYNLSLD